jgi:N6-adenosine-specific RNA methylase IME4
MGAKMSAVATDLLSFVDDRKFATILADPPWRFSSKKGKVAPEHKRLSRYNTLSFAQIEALPVGQIAAPTALYLWWLTHSCRRVCPS